MQRDAAAEHGNRVTRLDKVRLANRKLVAILINLLRGRARRADEADALGVGGRLDRALAADGIGGVEHGRAGD